MTTVSRNTDCFCNKKSNINYFNGGPEGYSNGGGGLVVIYAKANVSVGLQ